RGTRGAQERAARKEQCKRSGEMRSLLPSPPPLAEEGWGGGSCGESVPWSPPSPTLPRKRRREQECAARRTEVSFLELSIRHDADVFLALSIRHDGGVDIGAFVVRIGLDRVI